MPYPRSANRGPPRRRFFADRAETAPETSRAVYSGLDPLHHKGRDRERPGGGKSQAAGGRRRCGRTGMGDSRGHVQTDPPRNTKPRRWTWRGSGSLRSDQLQGRRQRQRNCRMQDQFTRTPRRRATVRRRGGSAASFRSARSSEKITRAWRSRIVEGLVQAQPLCVYLDRACRSAPRYRRRSWWLDTSTTAQSRRAVKRWHGCAQDLWRRNVEIAAWCALGATQAHVGAKYSLTRQRVGQIVREFPWVREAVLGRLEGRDENHGREGGKCQSSLRGWAGSDSAELEGVDRCSGEFRPLSRPNQARWRRICDRRGAGSRRRRKGTRPGGPLAALAAASLASAGGFPCPQSGGESASSAPAGRGGKVPVSLAEISRRWRLRGGATWRQRRLPILARPEAPALSGVRPYQAQRELF